MTGLDIVHLLLRGRLALARCGAIMCAALLCCMLGVLSWSWVVPTARASLAAAQRQLQQSQHDVTTAAADAAPVPGDAVRLARFYDALGGDDQLPVHLKTVLGLAEQAGVVIRQAEYKADLERNGRFRTYQVSLPVRGTYPAIRDFCDRVLHTLPFASLDTIRLGRDAIDQPELDGELRLTLFLADAATPAGSPVAEPRP